MTVVSNERKEYKRLNFSEVSFSDEQVTTEESLRDIHPFEWSKEVLAGRKEAVMKVQE